MKEWVELCMRQESKRERDAYRRGFEAARAAAIKAVDDTDIVEWHDSRYAQLGDAAATKAAIRERVEALKPEASQ